MPQNEDLFLGCVEEVSWESWMINLSGETAIFNLEGSFLQK